MRGGSFVAVKFPGFSQLGQHGGFACVVAYPFNLVDSRSSIEGSSGVERVGLVRLPAASGVNCPHQVYRQGIIHRAPTVGQAVGRVEK